HVAVSPLFYALGKCLCAAIWIVLGEGRICQSEDLVGTESPDLIGSLHCAGTAHDRLDCPAEPLRGGHDFVGDFAERPVALLQYCESRAHNTFASSRRSRTSSATAPAPSPTIFPS